MIFIVKVKKAIFWLMEEEGSPCINNTVFWNNYLLSVCTWFFPPSLLCSELKVTYSDATRDSDCAVSRDMSFKTIPGCAGLGRGSPSFGGNDC